MQCPNPFCQSDPLLPSVETLPNTELVMAERCGIEIDYRKHDGDHKNRNYSKSRHSGGGKKKSLLSELFDF